MTRRPIVLIILLLLVVTPAAAQDDLRNIPNPDPQFEKKKLHVPEGFEINLFASEPLVVKPIQMNWDAQGRLWVASSTGYPQLKPGQEAEGKILVLEDTDGDGRADSSIVFAEGLFMPTGLVPGDGGVYVADATQLLHLKDTDGDGRADQRRVVLSGFGTDDAHHLIHTFRWGPAGQLYFNQSLYIYSNVETPWGIRRLHGGGIWQLRPKSLKLDIYARGFINPWGHQFDRWGQSFVTDGAGRQGINYVFPGGAFARANGVERILEGLNPGQPKHSGLAILSGRHLPDSLQGDMITNDFRANAVNRFVITEDGSGYASEQAQDLVWTDYVAFRPVDVSVGPDGAIYIADWYNPIIQHGEVDFHDPRRDHRHGRIWRITAKDRPLVDPPDLVGASVKEQLNALKLPEAWTRQQAKRLLKERGADEVVPVLETWIPGLDPDDPTYEHTLLEALWVYQAVDVVNASLLKRVLESSNHRARAAAVRVLYYWNDRVRNVDALLADAVEDEHPRVRREAVTALGKRKTAAAARLALSVLDRPMDRFLDYALWHTLRELKTYWLPRLKDDPDYFGRGRKLVYALKSVDDSAAVHRLAQLYQQGRVPADYEQEVLSVMAEHGGEDELRRVFDMVLRGQNMDKGGQQAHLKVLEQAAHQRGRRPSGDLSAIGRFLGAGDDAIRAAAARLVGLWGIQDLQHRLVDLAEGESQSDQVRQAAVEGLALLDTRGSKQQLLRLANAEHSIGLRLLVAQTLPTVDVEEAANVAVEVLRDVPEATDPSGVFETLLSQTGGAKVFADVLEGQQLPEEVARAGLRVIRARGSRWLKRIEGARRLKAALEASGGTLPPPKMEQDLDNETIYRLVQEVKGTANPARGEKIYRRKTLLCMTCHAVGGAGGQVGPGLSSIGASAPIDYIIEALLKPGAAVKEGYNLMTVTTTGNSVVSGILVRETNSEVVLRDAGGNKHVIPVGRIKEREIRSGSLMPPGLTSQLTHKEFVDLVGFLSELGATENYSVPKADLVRRWRVLASTDEVSASLDQKGVELAATNTSALPWQPAYSTVSGELPLEDLPTTDVGGEPYSFVRFKLAVQTAGEVTLGFNAAEGLSLWIGQQKMNRVEKQTTTDLAEGVYRVTVAINRSRRGDTPLRIELLDAGTSSAGVTIVSGR